ncbi:MAG: hypothetical protein KME05_24790 [Gloeocapsa sp. UFS-A4-WI-NPMV-4B04]|jgi:hypothetical protein|nr:hypothetical protein [Gloeocapsa sp. UFS-A4-WI-NPMV-4B04]
MSKENSDYKKSLQQNNHTAKATDSSEFKNSSGNAPGSREDSMSKQGSSKKKKKK